MSDETKEDAAVLDAVDALGEAVANWRKLGDVGWHEVVPFIDALIAAVEARTRARLAAASLCEA